jgi:RES domain-containing protein
MIVYRCTLRKWSADLTGTGAFQFGGRWNNPGTHLLYTAENNVLAALEVALRVPLEHISKNYLMVPIEIPDDAEVAIPDLPPGWRSKPELTASVGLDFVTRRKHLAMKVPSALISDSYNFLINPQHPRMSAVKVQRPRPILFDNRLINLLRETKK